MISVNRVVFICGYQSYATHTLNTLVGKEIGMFTPLVAGLGGIPLQTILIVLVALAVGVLLARVALSIFWKVLVIGIVLVGALYAAGILL